MKKAYEDNLLMVFKTCHNHIYVTDGMQKQPAFFELLKLIFCKTLDEQNLGKPLEFYARSQERSNPDGQLTIKNRISRIFDAVKKQFPQIFEASDEIRLQPRSLAWIVAEIQSPYSLLETHVDVKGKAYEELVGANLRGDRGEFFTPRNIMSMAIRMINPKPDEKVCDPACGTGGFLVMAMSHVIEQLKIEIEREYGNPEDWSDYEKGLLRDRIRQIAASNFYGFDINPDLVKATKMNMVMNNDGSGNIYRNDSLLPPHEWSPDIKNQLAEALKIRADDIKNANTIDFFDVIVTNPPFGSKIPIKDSHILEQFELGYLWRNTHRDISGQSDWTISSDFQTSVPPEQLFIERCLQLLKPGGRLAIVLPDSILGNLGLEYIRQWLIEKTRIVASVDLHVDTFQPRAC